MYSAKGLEANRSFILADKSERDCMPLVWKNQRQSDYEQELNVIYVALTRSKETMYIVSSDEKTSNRHKSHFRRQWRKKKNSVTEITVRKEPEPIPTNVQTKEEDQSRGNPEVKKRKKTLGRIAITD